MAGDLQLIVHWEITLVPHVSNVAMQLVKYYCPIKDFHADINRLHAAEYMTKSATVPIAGKKRCGPNKVRVTWFTFQRISSISPTRGIPTCYNMSSDIFYRIVLLIGAIRSNENIYLSNPNSMQSQTLTMILLGNER